MGDLLYYLKEALDNVESGLYCDNLTHEQESNLSQCEEMLNKLISEIEGN